jgi:uncharacterized iron-regulated membrane protein
MSETTPASIPSFRFWPDYRTLWRWHFYAGLLCIPFVIVLSLSGSVYLFKPQVERWLDRPYDGHDVSAGRGLPSAQTAAALAAVPDGRLSGFELPAHEGDAARVLIAAADGTRRVYVHPTRNEVLGQVVEDQRLMRQMFRLHGELWMGDRGSNLVEIASCWTIVLILTGLLLWWPRGGLGVAGVLYPRLGRGHRIFWRDLHAVTGLWISCLVLFLLFTGLPWAKFWGGYFRQVRQWTGTAVARQDWPSGSPRPRRGGHSDHGGGGDRDAAGPAADLASLDRVVAAAIPLALPAPTVVTPPTKPGGDWTVVSNTQNRPLRQTVHLHPQTAEITRRETFDKKHWIDRVVGTCIAAHEGQLFGVANQLMGLAAAIGLIAVCLSAVLLWWRRREPGTLGAPLPLVSVRGTAGLLGVLALLTVLLPLFGASLLVVLLVERLMLRRLPWVSRWLGLAPAWRKGEA